MPRTKKLEPEPVCDLCSQYMSRCECNSDPEPEPEPDEDEGCPVCGCEECVCDDCDNDEPGSKPGLFDNFYKEVDLEAQRAANEANLKRRRELAENPSLIQEALPGFLELVRQYDEHMRADNITAANIVSDLADKYAADLQGGDTFGLNCPDGAAYLLDRASAPPDGEVPIWGLSGNFILRVRGILIRFEIDGIFGLCNGSGFSINAVRWDKPFPSETGFRNFFEPMARLPKGCTVAGWVRHIVEEYIAKAYPKGLPTIRFEYQDRHASDPVNALPVVGEPTPVQASLPVVSEPTPAPPHYVQTLFGPDFQEPARKAPRFALTPDAAQLSLFGA